MQSFNDWLFHRQETVEEGLGRNLLTMGLMGLGAMGASGCSGGKCTAPQTQPPSRIEKFSDYMQRTKNMHGKERTDQWKKRFSQRQAERDKGTSNELKPNSYTSPEANEFL